MSHKLIDLNNDLKKLRDEGFEIEVKDGYLIIQNVPYVNSNKKIRRGVLVSEVSFAGDILIKPNSHVIYFAGDYPCNSDGTEIIQIKNTTEDKQLVCDVLINHSFSSRPAEMYEDYYEKMITYMRILSAPAESIDDSVTAKSFRIIGSDNDDCVFQYLDTNSSRANILNISSKLNNLIIGIIGLGGTGSYVLDFVSKTHVKEINIFDGDSFYNHNAFRTVGAAQKLKIQEMPKKVNYLHEVYSNIHKNIIPHDSFIVNENLYKLDTLNFVFICIDDGESKKIIIDHLVNKKIPFIDTGIGVSAIDESLIASVRTTNSNSDATTLLNSIPFGDDVHNIYVQNIQIVELNAINAALAVVKWKKMFGFYHDLGIENNSIYNTDTNTLINVNNETVT